LIKTAKDDDSYVLKITDELDQIEIQDFKKLKNESKGIIFIVTKNYIQSPLFHQHSNEARELFNGEHMKFIVNREEKIEMGIFVKDEHQVVNVGFSMLKSGNSNLNYLLKLKLKFKNLVEVIIQKMILIIFLYYKYFSFK
jgi:hypothetical protein